MKYHAKIRPFAENSLPYFFTMVLLLGFVFPLKGPSVWDAIRSPSNNEAYAAEDFKEPLAIIQNNMERGNDGVPRIVARQTYFAYLADATHIFLPYTDYDGLLRYCLLNDVDYLLLEYKMLAPKKHPLIEPFEKGETPDFQLLYAGTGRIELYRFKPRLP